jgi:Beta-propeller repeat
MKFLSPKNLTAVLAVFAATAKIVAQTAQPIGSLPLWFESNSDGSSYTAHGKTAEFALSQNGAEITLKSSAHQMANVQLQFLGTESFPKLSVENALAGKINRLIGDNAAGWQSGLKAFTRVRLDEIYPGISAVFYGNEKSLEYDFNIAAGADPSVITMQFGGAEKISVNQEGELVIRANGGEITQHRPVAYQTIDGERKDIKVGYKILDNHTAAFTIGKFDHSQPLTIDPVLGYSTYFGGNYGDNIHAIAVGADGSIYAAGETLSTKITNSIATPFATSGAFQTNFGGGGVSGDAFVAKFDSTGTNLIYLTYLGGNDDDAALALAVDSSGDAYVTGYSNSTNFPTVNAIHSKIAGAKNNVTQHYPVDAFVAELNPSGSALVYSTYLGGNASDIGTAITVDSSSGTAYVGGYTYSTNLPVTSNAFQKHLQCTNSTYFNANGFVAQIAPNGSAANYLSYLGGTNFDEVTGISLDAAKNIYVCGLTSSTNYPNVNGFNSHKNLNGITNKAWSGASDAFVTRFQPAFAGIDYSTFLGSTNDDAATGIAADIAGNAYVVGWTVSTNFPNTTNGVQLSSYVRTNSPLSGATNAFLTKVIWTGTNAVIGYSQMFGGRGMDVASSVALDSAGNVFVAGSESSSTNYAALGSPIYGSLLATNSGGSDAIVTVFKSDFSALIYSANLGGRQNDIANAIAVDANGDAIIAGTTSSTNFPVLGSWPAGTPALHAFRAGTNDAFIAKILTTNSPAPHIGHIAGSGAAARVVNGGGTPRTGMVVYWPAVGDATPTNVTLETTTDLKNKKWTAVTNRPALINGNYIYTLDPSAPVQFFRIR